MLILLAGCLNGPPADQAPSPGPSEQPGPGQPPPGTLPPVDAPDEFLYAEGTILDFEITLDRRAMEDLSRDPRVDVPATFTHDGLSWEVGLHLKGHYSFRSLDGKAGFRIDFHQWDPDATFYGTRRLTLNNMVQDGSMLREHVTYWLLRLQGLPAPRHGYARVTVNGEWYGLYGLVETPDEQYLARHFADDDGFLYGGGYGADVAPGKLHYFDVVEPGDPPEPDMEALARALAEAEGEAYPAVLWANFTASDLVRLWATEIVTGNNDGYLRQANNFLLYADPGTGVWTMLPWGTDQAFRGNPKLDDGAKGVLARLCLEVDSCRDPVQQAIDDALAIWESADLPAYVRATAALIREDCEADPRRESPCTRSQENLVEYVEGRVEEVRRTR